MVTELTVAKAGPRWSRLPTRWIFDDGLCAFRGGVSLGRSVAALKLYVAIVLRAENKTAQEAGPHQGSASLSYDDFEQLLDLSRPMIASGLKFLASQGLIAIESGGRGRRNRYRLTGYGPKDHWVKIPNSQLFRSTHQDRIGVLYDMSCRREADMNALKLYLMLAAHRGKTSFHTMASYPTIWQHTGIPQDKIRRAISVLIDHNLIRVGHEKVLGDKRNAPNQYEIRGL